MEIDLDGVKHVVEIKKIDLIRVERALQMSITRFEDAQGMTAVYAMAWAAARRMKIAGIPESFEEFLDLDPDIDDRTDPDGDEGKDSGQAQTTG